MTMNAQAVIESLATRIAQLEVDKAILACENAALKAALVTLAEGDNPAPVPDTGCEGTD